jgi:hypothetical protein
MSHTVSKYLAPSHVDTRDAPDPDERQPHGHFIILHRVNMDDAESQYGNCQRAFLQAFIARSTLTFDDAKPILAAISTAHGTQCPKFTANLRD